MYAIRSYYGRKCGHAGTLDPIATGVLPVCVGRATKIAGYLAALEKEYDVFFRFGIETDTGDSTGRQIGATPGKVAEEDAVRASIAGLVGEWEQVPPAYSAIKVAGTRAVITSYSIHYTKLYDATPCSLRRSYGYW